MSDIKLLLLEDDAAIAMGLVYSLEKENFAVDHAKTLKEAREYLKNNIYSICILDINLPDGNEVKFVFDDKSLAESDLVKIVGKLYAGIGIVAPNAFCVITKPESEG